MSSLRSVKLEGPCFLRSLVVSTLAFIAAFCSGGTTVRAEPVNISAAVIGVTVSIWPALIAQQEGMFDKQGIKVNLITAGASSRTLQDVATGVADIGSSSMVDSVRAIEKGAAVRVFANSLAVGVHSLIAAKYIKSVVELKGKRIMTGGPKDITNIWWQAMALAHGLDPNNDVQVLYSGSTSNRLAALFAGGVAATILSPPQSFNAIKAGWTDLGPVAPYLGPFPMMIWHTNDAWAKSHAAALIAFARGQDEAVRYMTDPAHREEASRILASSSHATLDDALASWDLCMKVKAFLPDSKISDDTVQRVISRLQQSGDVAAGDKPVSTYYDGQYVDAAAK